MWGVVCTPAELWSMSSAEHEEGKQGRVLSLDWRGRDCLFSTKNHSFFLGTQQSTSKLPLQLGMTMRPSSSKWNMNASHCLLFSGLKPPSQPTPYCFCFCHFVTDKGHTIQDNRDSIQKKTGSLGCCLQESWLPHNLDTYLGLPCECEIRSHCV